MTAEVLGTVNQEAPKAPAPWIPDDRAFGARLALVRQRMEWGNVKEAALACGLPPESWRTWERDNVNPQKYQEVCEKIAARTGCDLGWLLGDRRARSGISLVKPEKPIRPPDNRPAGGPRSSSASSALRRPQRIRAVPVGSGRRRTA